MSRRLAINAPIAFINRQQLVNPSSVALVTTSLSRLDKRTTRRSHAHSVEFQTLADASISVLRGPYSESPAQSLRV